jgi:hypothetical protein
MYCKHTKKPSIVFTFSYVFVQRNQELTDISVGKLSNEVLTRQFSNRRFSTVLLDDIDAATTSVANFWQIIFAKSTEKFGRHGEKNSAAQIIFSLGMFYKHLSLMLEAKKKVEFLCGLTSDHWPQTSLFPQIIKVF